MICVPTSQPTLHRRRQIGVAGTAARVLTGTWLAGSVAYGHLTGTFRPLPWLVGLVGFPAVVLASHRWRARRSPAPLRLTGPMTVVANMALVAALYLTPSYAPALAFTSDAALLFYGTSMLLAAVRGYAGCEVLALSNGILRRDDQIGCLVFGPVDYVEGRLSR